MADGKTPDPVKASASTDMVAEGVDRGLEREVMVPYKATKGHVKDAQGRFHEVDDVDRFIAAYPGSEKVKAADVVKSKVGYADPTADELAAEAAKVAEGAPAQS